MQPLTNKPIKAVAQMSGSQNGNDHVDKARVHPASPDLTVAVVAMGELQLRVPAPFASSS
jgi:hypothetical protein